MQSFNELAKILQKCHDLIWEGGRYDPTTAFDEFCKILMVKIFDENRLSSNKENSFSINENESLQESITTLKNIYNQIRHKNPQIFDTDIKLSDEVIYDLIKILQKVSLASTDIDIKGRAFEYFLGKIFRDDYGQYFTPRNIISFMVKFLRPTKKDIIIDPACGSGGFLLHCMLEIKLNNLNSKIDLKNLTMLKNNNQSLHQFIGVEINSRIARVAMMDMIMHGSVHENILCNNALSNYSNFNSKFAISPNKYSIIFTNPPFGAVINDQKILTSFQITKRNKSEKTEILYIERCLELLKMNGRIGIVLPDSILTNSSLQYVRDFILQYSKILAIISLPQHTFVPSGAGVKSSLLFLEKIHPSNENYQIFMASVKHIGYNSLREEDTNELDQILAEWDQFNDGIKDFKLSFVIKKNKVLTNFSPEKYVNTPTELHWRMESLEFLSGGEIFSGSTPARKEYKNQGYKILKVRDLSSKGINWDNKERAFVSPEYFHKRQKLRLQINDILFITAAHHPKYIGQKIDIIDFIPQRFNSGVIFSAELMILRINSEIIDPYYLYIYLKSKSGYKAIQSCIRGQTAHIYSKDIKKLQIPIPPAEVYSKLKPLITKLKTKLNTKSKANEELIQTFNLITAEFTKENI